MFITLLVAGICLNTSVFAQLYGPNLIVNGDFAGGNTGFFTDYVFVDPEVGGPNSLVPEGRYTVADNPGDYHPNFTGAPFVGENFLIVNGATDMEVCGESPCDDNWIVWQQTVEIEEDMDYQFSFWLSSLVTTSPAQLSLTIEINGMPYSEVVIAPDETEMWVQQMWTNTEKSQTATITIIETTKVEQGNDFGIDDIVFRSVEFEPTPCPPLDVTINVTDVTCPGEDDGVIEVIMDGVKPFNICLTYGCEEDIEEDKLKLFDKAQTATYTGLVAGWYTITVFDGNGCPFQECVYVGEPEPLMGIVTDLMNPLCNGDANGMVTIEISGGVPPYTASMGTVEGNILTINDLGADEYNVVIEDSNGCGPAEVDFALVDPPVLVADYDATEILCNGDPSTVTVTASGGTPPYQLFDGDVLAGDLTEGSISLDVPADTYNWTVVDANGCEAMVSFTLTQPPGITGEVIVNEILCNGGEAEVELIISGGTPPYTVVMDGVDPIEEDGTFTFMLMAGSYTFSVTDANGCGYSTDVEITEPPLLEAGYETDGIACFGDMVDVVVYAMGGTPPYQLFDGDALAGDFVDGEITILVGAGEYNWTVVDDNGCEAEVSFVLVEPDPLVAALVSTQDATCFGFEDGSAVFSVTGGTMPYTADMGVFEDGTLIIDGLGAGEYTVTITDSKNCGPEEIDFVIDQPDEIIVENVDVEIPLCAPDNFPQCNTPWGVNWIEYEVGFSTYGDGEVAEARQNPDNTIGMPDYSNTPPITFVTLGYGGHIILEAGCLIFNDEGDDFEVVETSYGQDQCEDYPEKADVYVSQSLDGPWSYLGEICLTSALDLSDGIDKDTEEPFVLEWVQYIKIMDVSNPDDFSSGDGFDVNGIYIYNSEDPMQNASGITIEFSGVGDGEEPQFFIYEGEEVISISNTAELSGLPAGTYTVVVQVGECFSAPFEFTVPEFPEPIEAEVVTTDVLCYGEDNGTATVTVTGGTPPYSLSWEGLEEPVVIEEDGGSYLINGLAAGTYTIAILDSHECLGDVTFTIEEPEVFTVEQDNGEILCFEGTTWVSLDIQGGVAPYLLSDNNDDFELAIDTAGELELTGFAYGDYSWTVIDSNGCSVLVEFSLDQPDELIAEVAYEPILCNGGVTDVTVIASGGVGPYQLYDTEIIEDNLVVESFNPDVTLNELVADTYLWFVVDANGCAFELSFTIEEPEILEAEVFPGEILCYNGVTTALVVASGGAMPYSLFDGETLVATFDDEFLVEDLIYGSYSWTVTDANNCDVIVLEFVLENPEEIVIEVETVVDATCYGYDNGEIHVSATGGTGMLTYSLNGGEGQETGSFTDLLAGTYDVSVTDENGCTVTIEVVIEEPDEIIIDVFLIEPADFGEHNGEIWANIYGGTPPYNICLIYGCEDIQDNGDNYEKSQGVMYWGLQPGEWMIKVEDANGCIVYECVEVPELEEEKIDESVLSSENPSDLDQIELVSFPNPFRNHTTIEFIPRSSQYVTLEVYNLVGERVEVLFHGHVNAFEEQKHVFKPAGLPNGVYYVRLTMDNTVHFDKIILAR